MARRRKKTEDLLSYPNTPERQLETPSGYCMTQHHQTCPYQFAHGRCGCKCHTEEPKMQEPPKKRGRPKKDVQESVQDPRPWRQ